MNKISDLPAHKARNLIGQKKISSTELVKSCIEQYEKHNSNVNAIVASCPTKCNNLHTGF